MAVGIGAFTSNSVLNGTSLTLTRPTGIVAGDVLLILAHNEDNADPPQFNALTDWNLYGEWGDSTPDVHTAIYWRVATVADESAGSEVVTADTSNDLAGWFIRLINADPDQPIVANTMTPTNAAATGLAGQVGSTVDGCVAMAIWSFDGGDGLAFSVAGTGWPGTIPAGQELQSEATATGVSCGWLTKDLPSPAASANLTVSCNVAAGTDGWVVGQILLAPARPMTQDRYRWGLDDGTESGHTFAAAEDTPVTAPAAQRRLLRVQLAETQGADVVDGYRLQYKRADEADTEWRDI